MLSVRNLRKVYKSKKADDVVALDNVSIDFPETGFVFLLGKSGSGKSTLLNTIGGLDKFDGGEIIIKGKSSADFSQSDFDSYRNTFIGFIFQEYNILENFSVAKNLALALELQGKKADHEEVMNLLRQVDMEQYAKRKPNQLSGGQKQRVAIARALIKNPEIIMADEPTGALDSNTGKQVMDTLKELSKTKLIIVVSHDREFAELYGDRIIELKDGRILHDVTKKEIVAQETASGIKVIDNDIVYIKKGQQISEQEMKAIVNIINNKSKESDAFISFNKDANEKVKEGAKINDSGNKEKFLDTEREDIKVKQYNPNSLKLIRSRLKFSDSFKMGASALKNKVGKLIFTIFLSFFAFTVFGIIDALSQWNRAESVYQAMQMTGQTNIAMKKGVRRESWISSEATMASDLKALQQEFPNHVIKGVVRGNYWSATLTPDNYNLSNNNNPLLQTNVGGYVTLTADDVAKMKLTLLGDLPQAENEICISKHLFDALVSRTSENEPDKKITDFSQFSASNPLLVNIDGFYSVVSGSVKVVGIFDDGTNLDVYKNKEEQELMQMSYQISEVINYSWAGLVLVNQEAYEVLASCGSSIYYYMDFGQDSNNGWYSFNGDYYEISNIISNEFGGDVDQFISNRQIYLKSGINIENLAKDEIIVPEYYLSNQFTDLATAIEDGLTVRLLADTNDESAARELKVVGFSSWGGTYVSALGKADLDPLFEGYEFMVSSLIGDEAEDKRFITRLETVDANNVKFAVQNSTTSMLDMLEEILLMMTSVFVWIALAFAVFAALMLMNFISTSISYKKREIGVLRALGARGSDVFGIFFNESMVIATINFVLSTIATFVICAVINSAVLSGLSLEIALLNVSIRQMILIAGVSVASAFLGSFLPTFKISRKRPIDAINNR